MGSDKILAQWRWERHRISEKCLLIFGFLGPIGGWSGMYIFKHKTAPGKYLFRQNIRFLLNSSVVKSDNEIGKYSY